MPSVWPFCLPLGLGVIKGLTDVGGLQALQDSWQAHELGLQKIWLCLATTMAFAC